MAIDPVKMLRYRVLVGGSLQVNGLLPDDTGMFQCFARNVAGEVQTNTYLAVTSECPSPVLLPHRRHFSTKACAFPPGKLSFDDGIRRHGEWRGTRHGWRSGCRRTRVHFFALVVRLRLALTSNFLCLSLCPPPDLILPSPFFPWHLHVLHFSRCLAASMTNSGRLTPFPVIC